jgi:hypothetical protein
VYLSKITAPVPGNKLRVSFNTFAEATLSAPSSKYSSKGVTVWDGKTGFSSAKIDGSSSVDYFTSKGAILADGYTKLGSLSTASNLGDIFGNLTGWTWKRASGKVTWSLTTAKATKDSTYKASFTLVFSDKGVLLSDSFNVSDRLTAGYTVNQHGTEVYSAYKGPKVVIPAGYMASVFQGKANEVASWFKVALNDNESYNNLTGKAAIDAALKSIVGDKASGVYLDDTHVRITVGSKAFGYRNFIISFTPDFKDSPGTHDVTSVLPDVK